MINDSALLSIKANFPRPAQSALNTLAGVNTGVVVDCLGGQGAASLKPVTPNATSFVGTVITCDCGPADNLGVFAALKIAKPGDVIVVATSGYTKTAVIGDMVVGMAKNSGVVAMVTDGYVRDAAGICDVGIPCFAAGVTPNSPARNGPGSAGLAIVIEGVAIHSGDIIVGGCDGVVVVPHGEVDMVLEQLPHVLSAEADLDKKVQGGLKMPDFVSDLFESDQVNYLD